MRSYLGEIRMFAGDFAPAGWLLCDGRLLEIGAEQALYALIGTTYGGDGTKTFALPDLRGRVVVGRGHGPGLSDYRKGEMGGHESIKLSEAETFHEHSLLVASVDGTAGDPKDNVVTKERQNFAAPATLEDMSPAAVGPAGGGAPHENRQPYLVINYIISARGMDPSS